MIEIRTDDLPENRMNEPAVKDYIEKFRRWINDPRKFDRKERAKYSLHEGTHLYYTRACGFEPELYGPGVRFDSDGELTMVWGAVAQLSRELRMSCPVLAVAKTYLGPMFAEDKLVGLANGEQREWGSATDLDNFVKWRVRRQEIVGDIDPHDELIEQTRESVYKDCRSPEFRRNLWAAAWEFERRVYGFQHEVTNT